MYTDSKYTSRVPRPKWNVRPGNTTVARDPNISCSQTFATTGSNKGNKCVAKVWGAVFTRLQFCVSLFLVWVQSSSSMSLLWPCQPWWSPQSQTSVAGSPERGHSSDTLGWFQLGCRAVLKTWAWVVSRVCRPLIVRQCCFRADTAWLEQVAPARPVCKYRWMSINVYCEWVGKCMGMHSIFLLPVWLSDTIVGTFHIPCLQYEIHLHEFHTASDECTRLGNEANTIAVVEDWGQGYYILYMHVCADVWSLVTSLVACSMKICTNFRVLVTKVQRSGDKAMVCACIWSWCCDDVSTLSGYLLFVCVCLCVLTLSMVLRSLNEKSIHASRVVGSTNSLHMVGRKFSQSPSMLLFTRRAMDLDCSTTTDSVEPSVESSSSRTNCKRMAGSTVKPVYRSIC